MTPPLHVEALPSHQLQILRRLGPLASAEGFYLAGGTALALHLGHRRSMDFDWFRRPGIALPEALAARLRASGLDLSLRATERDTLHATTEGVATSFFAYDYPLVRPLCDWAEAGCALAAMEDIACMKLIAVAQRGERKDFIDLFAIATMGLPLTEALRLVREKYQFEDVGHILAGLAYFDDAEREPMPQMLWRDDWRAIRVAVQGWVKAYAG